MATLAAHGGIVEELIAGQEFASPSVQLRITPRGQVEFLSTHDQMLGGPTGLRYLGARFPANPAYTPLIIAEALKVGQHLAREGVIGRFGIDFVVVRSGGGPWQAYAIEITLSKGGTTHPFLTLQYLTDGVSDPVTGAYRTAQGAPKCYVATDSLESPLYRHFTGPPLRRRQQPCSALQPRAPDRRRAAHVQRHARPRLPRLDGNWQFAGRR